MRTTLRPAVMKPVSLNPSVCALFDYSSIPLRRALILSVELVLGPGEKEKSDVSDTVLTSILPHQIVKKKCQQEPDLPMVPMMEVRRKFFAGTISVLSLECHSSFIRLLRWSRELLTAILSEGLFFILLRERKRERQEGMRCRESVC